MAVGGSRKKKEEKCLIEKEGDNVVAKISSPNHSHSRKKTKHLFFLGGGGGGIVDVRRIRVKDVSKVSVFFRGQSHFFWFSKEKIKGGIHGGSDSNPSPREMMPTRVFADIPER